MSKFKKAKSALLDEINNIIDTAIAECRNLTAAEEKLVADYQQIINSYDAEIKKEQRNHDGLFEKKLRQNTKSKNVTVKGTDNMKEFREFLLDENRKTYVENREGESLVSDNQAIVPHGLAGQVVLKVTEHSNLFADMQLYTCANGELSIPKEKADNLKNIVFVGENVKLTPEKVAFDAVKITTKRCGTAVKISDQFLMESGVNVESYVLDLLSRRLSKGLDYQSVKGTESIEGLDQLTTVTHGIVETTSPVIAGDVFVEAVAQMNPTHLSGAKFVMNRKTFADVSKLVDGAGSYLLVLNFQQDQPVYRILGVPVEISDAMEDNRIYLANMNAAYAKVIRNNVRVKRVADDSENALAAMNLFIMDLFVGAKCVDGSAVVRIKIGE